MTPQEMRNRCFRFIKASLSEPNQKRKKELAARAFVLAQMAEQEERDAAWRDDIKPVRSENKVRAEILDRVKTGTLGQMLVAAGIPAYQFGASMFS